MGEKLKSAVELAMERLSQGKDASAPLSDEQKQQIAEVRNRTAAELAKLEILHKSGLAELANRPPAETFELREKLRQGFVDDRARLERERDTKLERIRAQSQR
jgi:hypothetical protein